MPHFFNQDSHRERSKGAARRFMRVTKENSTSGFLQGCKVVTIEGVSLGIVQAILMDCLTQRVRYVILQADDASAAVALPWHTLYFDSVLARLVFYTYS